MKIPAIITLLILAVSATIGWRQWKTLQQLRDQEHAVASNAAGAASERNASESRSTSGFREPRTDHEAEARTVTTRMIANLVEQAVHAPGEPYQNMERRIERILEQLYQMSGLQLRAVIAELRGLPQPDGNVWYRKFLSITISALADTDPEAAMAFLAEDKDRGKDDRSLYDFVIGKWASADPLAALAWMRENPSKVSSHEGRASFISGLATKDPRLALQSLLEFKVYDLHGDGEYEGQPNFSVAGQIVRTARTLEERSMMLGILREIGDTPGEDPDNIKGHIVNKALQSMAEGVETYGYERASAWLDSLNLRPGETVQFMKGLRISETKTKGDTGKWFEWMGEHLSPEEFESAADQRITEWVREDPRAVEKWLATAADGSAKREAESQYASYLAAQQQDTESKR